MIFFCETPTEGRTHQLKKANLNKKTSTNGIKVITKYNRIHIKMFHLNEIVKKFVNNKLSHSQDIPVRVYEIPKSN